MKFSGKGIKVILRSASKRGYPRLEGFVLKRKRMKCGKTDIEIIKENEKDKRERNKR